MDTNWRLACEAILFAALSATTSGASDGEKVLSAAPPEARAIIQRDVDRSNALRTVEFHEVTRYVRLDEGDKPDAPSDESLQETRFAFERPNSYCLERLETTVRCDGKTLWLIAPRSRQYIEVPAPAPDRVNDTMMELTGEECPMILNSLLNPVFSARELASHYSRILGVRHEALGGRPGDWVLVEYLDSRLGDGPVPPSTMEIWHDEATGLTVEARGDVTAAYQWAQEQAAQFDEVDDAPVKIASATWTLKREGLRVDEPIALERFRYTPEPGFRKVETWEAPSDMPQQDALVGKAAPAIEGKDLAGADFRLADLRGHVVVVDFWATWCGPCVAALPKMQALSQKFADKAVTFVGVNTDARGGAARARKLLEKKGVTFRQFDGSDGAASLAYGVRAIPCAVLIDAQGVIQDIHTGFGPGDEDELAKKIERALAGENLAAAPPDEKRANDDPPDRAAFARDMARAVRNRGSLEVAETRPETLRSVGVIVPMMAPRTGMSGHATADTNGDGVVELLLPQHDGSLVIVSEDGATKKRVRFKAKPSVAGFESFTVISVGAERRWIVTRAGFQTVKPMIGLFTIDGETLWTHEIEGPAGLSASFDVAWGDLTGDGVPELVASASLNTMGAAMKNGAPDMSNYATGGALLIFDVNGRLLAQKKIGEHVSLVHVTTPAPGGTPEIICGSYSGVRRYTFDPNAAAENGLEPVKDQPQEQAP